jgi:hypothetical protein
MIVKDPQVISCFSYPKDYRGRFFSDRSQPHSFGIIQMNIHPERVRGT